MNDTPDTDARSADFEQLHVHVQGLIGRKCWKIAFTYGGELSLHFGRRLAYHNPKMVGKRRGEWRLDTRATAWTAFTPRGTISSKERDQKGEKAVEAKLQELEGRKVTNISVSVPDNVLTIEFGQDDLFRVTPTRTSAGSDLAYWRLFMPEHKQVTFGPGPFWKSLVRQTGACNTEEAAHVPQKHTVTKNRA
jgi:hypothetical protein